MQINPFPIILAIFTKYPRQKVEIRWSHTSMIHNIFRIYEIIFYRRSGIRAESAFEVWTNEKGVKIGERRWFFTWEALFAHYEQIFYQYIKNLFRFRLEWVPIAIPSFAGIPNYHGNSLIPVAYLAIAFDAVSVGTAAPGTSVTFSHTCTGSNLILFTGVFSANTSTTVTYNAVSLTNIDKQIGAGEETSLWYLINPATGANNIVASQTSSGTIRGHGVSYTGAKQSGVPDATAKQTVASVSSITQTLTTIADNCWMVMMVRSNQDNLSAGTGSTLRGVSNTSNMFDNNAAITPAGANSMTVTDAQVGQLTDVAASFAPAVTAVSPRRFLNLLGVDQ